MPFRPAIKSTIQLNGLTYYFTEHPAAKGMPYGQTGRRATVYQIQNGQDLYALKVFTKAFRVPQIKTSARRIADFAHLPGLQVCARGVLTRQSDQQLLEQYPDLEYAVVMPWVQGLTWQEIMLARQPLSPEQSIEIARNFVSILAAMEEHGLAHCDLSGPNILLDDTMVNLVDVEDMYGPGLEQPEKLPGGSAGYAHKTAAQGLWSAEADRFAGAVLVAEILGWSDERVRRIAVGEQYFDVGELQAPCDRYNILLNALTQRHGHALAENFTSAWYSKRLEDCPRFVDWKSWLGGNVAVASVPPSKNPMTQNQVVLNDAGRYLFDSIKEKIGNQDFAEAEQLISALKVLAPGFDEPASLLAQARQKAKDEQARVQEVEQLERELAQKLGHAQSIQKEIDKLQAELLVTKATCAEIEQKLAAPNDKPLTTVADAQQKEIVTHTPQVSVPLVLPVTGRKKASLIFEHEVEHTKMLGFSRARVEDGFFLRDGRRFLTFSDDKKVTIWAFGKGLPEVLDKFNLTDAPYFAVLDKEGRYCAVGGVNGIVEIWDVAGNPRQTGWSDVPGEIAGMDFHPLKDLLAVNVSGDIVFVSKAGTLLDNMSVHGLDIESICYTPNGNYLACASQDGKLRLLQTSDYSIVAEIQTTEISTIIPDSKSRFLCCADDGGNITILDIPYLRTLLSFSLITDNSDSITSLAISPDDTMLVTATTTGDIHLWRLSDGKLLDTATEHTDDIWGLDFHPSGNHLLSASYDGLAIIWKIK